MGHRDSLLLLEDPYMILKSHRALWEPFSCSGTSAGHLTTPVVKFRKLSFQSAQPLQLGDNSRVTDDPGDETRAQIRCAWPLGCGGS